MKFRDKRTYIDDEVYANTYKSDDVITAWEKTNFQNTKDKITSCVPYKREKIVLSTIIIFYTMNLDKTNLRKQTRVHLLWSQAPLIVDERGIKSPEDDFIFLYNMEP